MLKNDETQERESVINNEVIGRRLRTLRAEKGYKQFDLARELNVSQQSYCLYEKNFASVSVETLVKICKLYNVSANYILGLSDERTPLIKEDKGMEAVTEDPELSKALVKLLSVLKSND